MNNTAEEKVLMHTYVIDWLRETVFDIKNIIIFLLAIFILIVLRKKISILYQRGIDFARKRIKNKQIKKFFYALANIFSSVYFTAIVTVVVPYFIDIYQSKMNLIVFWWIVFVLINAMCGNYIKGRDKAQKWFLTALRKFKRIQNDTAEAIYDTRTNLPKIITTIMDNNLISKDIEDFYFRFDKAAQIACESIYEIIKDVTGYTEHYVTVYKRYQDKNGKICPRECPIRKDCKKFNQKDEWTKMIACYHQNGTKSMSAEQEHCFEYCVSKNLEESSQELKRHFYIHFFTNNETKVEVITGKNKIKNKFLFHESCKTREEKIEQYIGIPLYYSEKNSEGELSADITTESRSHQHVTYAVIQIDFQDKGIIGKTKQSIQEFIDNVFGGIITYLETALQVEEVIKNMLRNVSDISIIAEEVLEEEIKKYDKLVKEQEGYEEMLNEFVALEDKYNELMKRCNEYENKQKQLEKTE